MQTRYSAGAMGEIANLTYDFSYLRREPLKPSGGERIDGVINKTRRTATQVLPKEIHEQFDLHWGEHLSIAGVEYEQCEPAYRFGYAAARHPFYYGYSWTDAEPSLKLDWADEYAGSKWEQFKAAIRAGWDLGNQ